MAVDQDLIHLEGQITWRRRFHATFSFFDLRQSCDGRVHTLLVSSGNTSVDDTKAIIRGLRLGDVVRLSGRYRAKPGSDEARFEVAALLAVLNVWADNHGDRQFEAQPRARAAGAAGAPAGAGGGLTATVCKRFVSGGRCDVTDCPFAHDTSRRAEWVDERRALRRAAAQQESAAAGDPHGPEAKQSAARRATVFAAWLVETFGAEALGAGGGVLDIGGGRGDLSFELHTLRGVRCCLVDPRRQRPRKHVARYLREHAGASLGPHLQACVGDGVRHARGGVA